MEEKLYEYEELLVHPFNLNKKQALDFLRDQDKEQKLLKAVAAEALRSTGVSSGATVIPTPTDQTVVDREKNLNKGIPQPLPNNQTLLQSDTNQTTDQDNNHGSSTVVANNSGVGASLSLTGNTTTNTSSSSTSSADQTKKKVEVVVVLLV